MKDISIIEDTLLNPVNVILNKIVGFLPNIASAVFLLLVGYIFAKFVSIILIKLLQKIGIDKLGTQTGINGILGQQNIKSSLSKLLGMVIFWVLMLTFMVSAADSLGLEHVSGTINKFALYLPKIFGSAIVLLLGMFLANFLRRSIDGSATEMGFAYAKELSIMIYGIVTIISISLAIGQLDIETTLLNYVVGIIILAIALAVALSLGIGTRGIANNVVAGIYVRDIFSAGMLIEINDISGKIKEIGTTKTLIEGLDNKIYCISNYALLNETVSIQQK